MNSAAVAHHVAKTDEEAELRDWINGVMRAGETAVLAKLALQRVKG